LSAIVRGSWWTLVTILENFESDDRQVQIVKASEFTKFRRVSENIKGKKKKG
jgi:hypothetical protein